MELTAALSRRSLLRMPFPAVQALDKDNNGWVEAELMQALLTEQGNPAFRPKELQEFMRVALDKKSGRVYYEDYVALMAK